jgi:hypothetical protein
MVEEYLSAWGTTGVLQDHLITVTNVALPRQTSSFDVIITVLQMINTDLVDPMVEITLTQ